jgi:tripartite-type tricarboxylate transporter receptor subunit TctC
VKLLVTGSSGLIGAERVARAAPDGYTIGGYNDSILTMVPHMMAKMPWNALTDFEPISLVGTIEWGLVVKADGPYKTLSDFLNAAKAKPGKLNYSSGGNGSPQHIGMALVANRANIDITHVPYKGATPAAVAVAAGEVDAAMRLHQQRPEFGKLALRKCHALARRREFLLRPVLADRQLDGVLFPRIHLAKCRQSALW